ncbi:MAG: large-conductance mechanosensitive channel protein MscL [Prevotella sp.]|jgi:large conductance mechanosensitive channel|nr:MULTISPECIES: large-conductance mechanosensitive channel protein MscL [unclassified Prevotella]MCH3970412.1 large-conductance mechanosensitive channel protein MscL [Prevotella sp.]MCH3991075.1 large-conductance mechanosensitive channel protein MscL [Prevotella sp.]MCH4018214.1 large-conductance mechanosensitive channel protein MscL [Prevotella sp.]MCH4100532.1 large-conductance mechanosensitive channel protein MscL [Prevotella sp.]MCH4185572.1 large-conductance mechanosensitive channel prot
MSKFIQEFKQFAIKGNAIDMAVGVIIGTAFGKVVSSIVDDIIMPPIGWLIGGVNFSELKVTLPSVVIPGVEQQMKTATINYGNFIQTLLNFFIIALCVFLMVKSINRMTGKRAEAPKPAPQPTNEEKLLTEIRDLMRKEKEQKDR